MLSKKHIIYFGYKMLQHFVSSSSDPYSNLCVSPALAASSNTLCIPCPVTAEHSTYPTMFFRESFICIPSSVLTGPILELVWLARASNFS